MIDKKFDLVTAGLDSIESLEGRLARGTHEYDFYDGVFQEYFSTSGFASGGRTTFGPFGDLLFPFVKMGAVSSLDLFGLDELILFAIYRANRARYSRFADLGANLGLHSLVASRLGWRVTAFEPDPSTFALLEENLLQNSVCARAVRKAVGAETGERIFTRVLGNLTGSHLSGSKADPYGELEVFPVETEAISKIMAEHDFLKIDVEGAEAELICSTSADDWLGSDAVVEIGSKSNAAAIFDHFQSIGVVSMFAQKQGWGIVRQVADLPVSHREGSVFISASSGGPFAQ